MASDSHTITLLIKSPHGPRPQHLPLAAALNRNCATNSRHEPAVNPEELRETGALPDPA